MTSDVVNISGFIKRKVGKHPMGDAKIFLLSSHEHVVLGASKRGYILLPDADVPRVFSVLTKDKQLVGMCEFSIENRLSVYSMVNMNTGKYITRDIYRHASSSIDLTTMLFDNLATL